MKRGGRIVRKTELRAKTPLKSGGFLKRGAFVAKQPPVIRLPKPTKRLTLPKPLRDVVSARDEGLCVLCGGELPRRGWHCHHRKLKSQGGRDEAPNLIGLHDPCHSHIHMNPNWSKQRGYIVHPNTDPATRPVLRFERSWQLPGDGQWIDTEAPSDYQEEAA